MTDKTSYYVDKGWGDKAKPFALWMEQVDLSVQRMISLSVHDLPDQAFADMFEDGYYPEDAAREILENEGFPLD